MTRGSWSSIMAVAACAASVAAAAPSDVLDPPAGFGVRLTGTLERVVVAEAVAQSPGPVDRSSIEAQCDSARAAGLTTRQPVFEAGHDQPIRTETLRVGNARHQADFVTRHVYECATPPRTANSADFLCGCTYRVHIRRSVQVGRRDIRPAQAKRALDRVRRLMPEVLGADTVAGIACIWRRLCLPDDVRVDRCIADGDIGALPPFLHGRALAEVTARAGDPPLQSSRVTRVVLHARVDAGVFAVRPSDVPKEPPQ
jgi:hypothetical protein